MRNLSATACEENQDGNDKESDQIQLSLVFVALGRLSYP
jgi:hypothetical protein